MSFRQERKTKIMSLKTKLLIGFCGLLGILLTVGLMSIRTSNDFSTSIERILRENYDSVVACYTMKGAIEHLDRIAMTSLWETHGNTPPDNAQTDIQSNIHTFSKNLFFQEHNVTVPGEQALTDQLAAQWETYHAEFENLLRLPDSEMTRLDFFRHHLLICSDQIRDTAQKIMDLNLNNMVAVDGQTRLRAMETKRTMILLVLSGVVLALVFIALIWPAIFRPIAGLTRSVNEIQQGNLDLVVNAHSKDEVGQLARAFNDMTLSLRELRRSDHARLLRTRHSTQLALDCLSDAVAICNVSGNIELANDVARRIFNLKPESSVNASEYEKIREIFAHAVSGDSISARSKNREDVIQVFQDGEECFFLPEAIPIQDDEKQLIGVTLVLSDFTCMRQLDELKRGMISTVSHQLKTPLTSIRLAMHVLLSEKLGMLSPKQTEILATARDDSDRLSRIIDNLLDISRLESGKARIQLHPVPAEQLILQPVDEMRTAFVDQGIRLTIDVSRETPSVMADELQLRHVFENLLSNALKHTSAGGVVKVTAQQEQDIVRFAVEDTGAGIPEAYLPHIFEKFFRASDHEQYSDTGLGLSIAREIVEAHGGHIDVASQVGKGTRFSFTLHTVSSGEAGQGDHIQKRSGDG
jgi:signal transduction histidine kinase